MNAQSDEWAANNINNTCTLNNTLAAYYIVHKHVADSSLWPGGLNGIYNG